MLNKKLKLSALFLLGFGLAGIQAQEAILATGGNASGSGGSASYSVGQVVYTTNTGINGSVVQGVQQTYDISTLPGIDENTGITLRCSAYPNPTDDFLVLKTDNEMLLECTVSLYDISAKLVGTKEIEGYETSIDMSALAPSTYYLKVTLNQKEIQQFKIIKN